MTQTTTDQTAARRQAMLRAAAELITERGFGETRIADVAKRAGTSTGLVIYYFGTRDRLLVDALKHSEEAFYAEAAALLDNVSGIGPRIRALVSWSCVPQLDGEIAGAWGLWLDVWATAFRHPEVAEGRLAQDRRWREMIQQIVTDAIDAGEVSGSVDARRFSLTFTTMLDGLSTQVALKDPDLTPALAEEIALEYAGQQLGLDL